MNTDIMTIDGKEMRRLDLHEIQKRELEIFKVFTEICEKYGIRYYLAGGTLLGAVRHHGFIPWDDDIDVNMPREDYDKLLAHADEIAASGDYKLAAYELGNLNYPFAKIYDLHTSINKLYDDDETERNLWIDIFPMDGLPDDEREVRRIFNETQLTDRFLNDYFIQSLDDNAEEVRRETLELSREIVERGLSDLFTVKENYLGEEIMQRLQTGAIYQIVANFNRSVHDSRIEGDQYHISEQENTAKQLLINNFLNLLSCNKWVICGSLAVMDMFLADCLF